MTLLHVLGGVLGVIFAVMIVIQIGKFLLESIWGLASLAIIVGVTFLIGSLFIDWEEIQKEVERNKYHTFPEYNQEVTKKEARILKWQRHLEEAEQRTRDISEELDRIRMYPN